MLGTVFLIPVPVPECTKVIPAHAWPSPPPSPPHSPHPCIQIHPHPHPQPNSNIHPHLIFLLISCKTGEVLPTALRKTFDILFMTGCSLSRAQAPSRWNLRWGIRICFMSRNVFQNSNTYLYTTTYKQVSHGCNRFLLILFHNHISF